MKTEVLLYLEIVQVEMWEWSQRCTQRKIYCSKLFSVVLGFELRALYLLGRHSPLKPGPQTFLL
jgi:hypothetical protein